MQLPFLMGKRKKKKITKNKKNKGLESLLSPHKRLISATNLKIHVPLVRTGTRYHLKWALVVTQWGVLVRASKQLDVTLLPTALCVV